MYDPKNIHKQIFVFGETYSIFGENIYIYIYKFGVYLEKIFATFGVYLEYIYFVIFGENICYIYKTKDSI